MLDGLIIDKYGTKRWYKEGVLHREEDLPAIEYINRIKIWYKNGLLHRDNDHPAIEDDVGTKKWYKEGKLHREGGLPAIIWGDGDCAWYYKGKYLDVSSNKDALKIINLIWFW